MNLDFESLQKLAVFLFVPCFATAGVVDGWLLPMVADFPPAYEGIGLLIRFTVLVFLFFLLHFKITPLIFRYATYGVHDGRELLPLPLVLGTICLAFGLYGVGAVLFPTLDLPKSPANVFWHLGCLAYGFFLLL